MTNQFDEAYPLITPAQLTNNSLIPIQGPGQPFNYFIQANQLASSGGASGEATTVAAFTAATYPASTKVVEIQGYYNPGDWGAQTVRRVNSQPAHTWKYQTADGAWWEGFSTLGFITLEQFGCPTDGVSDCFAAWNLANLYCIYQGRTLNVPPPEIFFPGYKYVFSQTLTPGTNPTTPFVAGCPVHMRGNYTQQNAYTILSFPQDTTGIFFSPFCYGGRLKDLYITGPWSTAATQMNSGPAGHGIIVRTLPIIVENCTIYQFSGHGIWVLSGDQGDGYGYTNCDGFRLDRFNISWTGQCGLRMEGPDSQVAQITNGNISNCGLTGIYEAAPYANSYDNVQVSFCGIPFAPGGSPNVALLRGGHGGVVIGSDGKTYMVAQSKDTLASTTDPVGDVTGVWLLVSNSTYAYWETWTNGHQYNFSPTVFSEHGIFDNIYSESTNHYSVPGILKTDAVARGNGTLELLNGDGYRPAYQGAQSGPIIGYSGIGAYEHVPPRNSDYSTNPAVGKILQTYVGGRPESGYIINSWDEYTNEYAILFYDRTNKEVCWKTDPNLNPLWRLAGAGVTNTYGRAAAIPYLFNIPYGIGTGNTTNMRLLRCDPTFPMADGNGAAINFATGDIQINPNTTYNTKVLTTCVAGGLGAAATFYNFIAAPINYVFHTVSTAPTANVLQLLGSDITGGINEVYLDLTANLGAGASAALPTVANLVTALGDKFFPGVTFKLYIINTSLGAFSWTLTNGGDANWTALNGTLTIAQNTMRSFIVTLPLATQGNVQALNQVAYP